MQPLPIDPLLPEIVARALERRAAVVTAEPGAGKTTRVPPALLGALPTGEILVLEPRRLAARLAARRVAEERGERLGETVGFQVRFEEVAGPRTRLRFVTEGLLARRLLSDPTLRGVAVVLLDELHERSVHTDLTLALLRRLQLGPRPDLVIVAMSATLDAGPVAGFLGGAPVLHSEGRRFEVRTEELKLPDQRPLEQQVASAVRRLLGETDGDVLVFLPGAAEIRRAGEALGPLAAQGSVVLRPLHGSLPPDEQELAVRPDPRRRKVILATNVAETSVTIDGVTGVVDTGLARVAGHSVWSGLPSLRLAKVSRASAVQRAGRAGRTRPGVCLRLFTRHDLDGRPAFETPEILRSDLAEPVLSLKAAGVTDLAAFGWFEPPPAEALAAAEELLRRLGAVAASGEITELGRRLVRFPLHPRLARFVVEAERRGAGADAAALAALLGERDIRVGAPPPSTGPSDPLELLEAFRSAGRSNPMDFDRRRRSGVDPGGAARVDRARRQLEALIERRPAAKDPDRELQIALLAAFPDRVARRRRKGEPELLLSQGGAATLARESVVREAELVVAVDAEESGSGQRRNDGRRSGQPLVRSASAIEPEWLLDLFPDELRDETVSRWNAEAERVDSVSRLVYGELVLEEGRAAGDPERVAAVLAEAALARGPRAFGDPGEIDRLLARLAFVRERRPDAGLPELGEEAPRVALAALCQGRRGFAELREASLSEAILAGLSFEQRRLVAEVAPDAVSLPSGRRARVEYAPGQPPWIESRLADFFGLARGPRVDQGRLPLALHLLAPNGRAVQVTQDLAGFWQRHYPQIRRELSRRYPRHPWPDDPTRPLPPRPPRR